MPDGIDNKHDFTEDEPAIVYHNPVAERRLESRDWMKGAVAFLMASLAAAAMFFAVRSTVDSALLGVGSTEKPAAEEAEQKDEGATEEGEEAAAEEEQPEEEAAEAPEQAAPTYTGQHASSELPPDNDTRSYGPANAVDGNLKTAWNEGSSGDGTGEWIELTAESKQRVTGLRIAGGYQSDEGTYYDNRRPSKIQVSFDDYTSYEYDLNDTFGDYQTITFPEPKDTTTVRVTILSTYAGNAYNDCCISEIQVV